MKKLLQKAKKYFQSPKDIFIFIEAGFRIAIMPLRLKQNSLDTLLGKMTYGVTKREIDIGKITVYVNWWLNRKFLMFQPTCMKRSLALYQFYREAGMPVSIYYGIRKKQGGGNEGHSWLTLDGKLLPPDGDAASQFHRTFVFPPENSKK